ncbi:putative effector protein/Pectate lyase [Ceratobasidium theobromae]|uniref:Pectate lyase n=1 Tax=Ceratobasidium theobromae TaxID=1582974 RepID=A0A5N5QJN7_9AGAM|nr:putative effector protein/Pectate lyase [Ceratobasidium theobromae]
MVQLSALILLSALSAFPHAVLAEHHLDSDAEPVLDSIHDRRQASSCNFPNPPASSNVKLLDGPIVVKAGEPFDGKGLRYGRGLTCNPKDETGKVDAVFILEPNAVVENVVVGADVQEGIHCRGPCTVRNVWFENVCEDAVTIQQKSGVSTITGGGAKGAVDKVVQHNGGGMVNIQNYCVQDFGALYRSCGNCGTQVARQVKISQVTASNGRRLAGVNSNYGDVATIEKTARTTGVQSMCDTFKGNNVGAEPDPLTTNEPNARDIAYGSSQHLANEEI